MESKNNPEMTSDESPTDRSRLPEGLASKFEAWAKEVLAAEEPPAGLDRNIIDDVIRPKTSETNIDKSTDSYMVWSALTALIQEIKLQSRTFKNLHETLIQQFESAGQTNGETDFQAEIRRISGAILEQLNRQAKNRDNEVHAETERRVRREMLGVFLDMRERLLRGLDTDQTGEDVLKPSWIDRISGRAADMNQYISRQAARKKGYLLTLERLEDSLRGYGVLEIKCLGRPFDPKTMTVVDILETDDQPDGQVIEVYQSGYEWNGDVFQTAKVKVTRQTTRTGNATNATKDASNQ